MRGRFEIMGADIVSPKHRRFDVFSILRVIGRRVDLQECLGGEGPTADPIRISRSFKRRHVVVPPFLDDINRPVDNRWVNQRIVSTDPGDNVGSSLLRCVHEPAQYIVFAPTDHLDTDFSSDGGDWIVAF
jgi:hypothetical protein